MKLFIPIKQNSQRVPNKNFRLFDGVPLYKNILYKFNNYKIYVDTDSDEIIEEVKTDDRLSHVVAYRRPYNLVGDKTSVCDLIENFIKKNNIQNEVLCQLHVTSPFLKTSTIKEARKKMTDHDSVVSCNVISSRLWRQESYGTCPVNHNPLKLEQTQDLPKLFEENSLFYMFKSDNFLKTKSRIGLKPYFFQTSFPENIDIDWEEDWQIATSMIGVLK